MKRVAFAFLVCVFTATTVSASTLTDKLKASITPDRFRIEFLRCDEAAGGQTGSAITYKLSYGQKGDDYYVEYTFPEYRDRYDSIGSRFNPHLFFVNNSIHEEIKKGRSYSKMFVDTEYADFDENGSLHFYSDSSATRFDTYLKTRPEDLTVVKDGKAYVMEKGTETGVYIDLSDAYRSVSDGKVSKIIEDRVFKPPVLEKLLLADPGRYQISFVGSAKAIYQFDAYTAEIYTSKKAADKVESTFTLFYDSAGNLRLVSEGKRPGENLYRVISFDRDIDEYNFECIPHYALQPMKGSNAAKGAKQ